MLAPFTLVARAVSFILLLQQPVREASCRIYAAALLRRFAARCTSTRPSGFHDPVLTFRDPASSQGVFAAEMLDTVVEAVVTSPDPRTRAVVIASMVHEMCAAARWLHETDTPLDDATAQGLASIGLVAQAAQDHYLRMSSLFVGGAGKDRR